MKIVLRVGDTAREEGWGQGREDGNVRDAGDGAFSQRHKLEDGRRPRLHGGEAGSLSTSREKGDTLRLGRAECRRSWGCRDSTVPMRCRKQQLLFLVSIVGSGLQCSLHIPSPLLSAHPFISWHPSCLQLGKMNSTPVSCGMARHFLCLCTAFKRLQYHFLHVCTEVLAVCYVLLQGHIKQKKHLVSEGAGHVIPLCRWPCAWLSEHGWSAGFLSVLPAEPRGWRFSFVSLLDLYYTLLVCLPW